MENDLIYRSTALAILRDLKEVVGKYAPVDDVDDAIDMVKNVKAIDAVEVVRCKDCVYVELPKCCPYQINGFKVTPDWYCPMGVRTPAEVK